MARSKSSKKWLTEHFNDVYVKKAQAEGYRSRAIYKLKEMDEFAHLFKTGMTVLDLGAAPGSWAQFVSSKLNGRGTIIAVDMLPMAALAGVDFILGDFREDVILEQLLNLVPAHSVDVLLSDMSPNMSGNIAIDIPCAMYLAELVFDFSKQMLRPGANLLMKVFHGSGFDELIKQLRCNFDKIIIRKPLASRPRSRETYVLARGFNL